MFELDDECKIAKSLQEAQLLQRYRATCGVSKFVLCFTSCGSYKGFKQQRWPSRSFKSIGVVCVIPRLAVLIQFGLWRTGGQTDGRTHDDSIYRSSIVSRSKNYWPMSLYRRQHVVINFIAKPVKVKSKLNSVSIAVSTSLAFTATGNSHAIWDHTVLPATRQSCELCL